MQKNLYSLPPPPIHFLDLERRFRQGQFLPPPPPPPFESETYVNTVRQTIQGVEHTFEIHVYNSEYILNTPRTDIIELLRECYPYDPHFIPNSLIYALFDTQTHNTVGMFVITPERPDPIPVYLWDSAKPSFYVYDVCTHPHFRGFKLQELLMRSAFDHLKDQHAQINIYLEVLSNNVGAIRLYNRLGFVVLKEVIEKWKSSAIMRLIV